MFQSKAAFARRAAIALAFAIPAFSAAAPAFAETVEAVEARAASLEPGQYVWQPQLASSGEIEIVVSLPQQIAYVFRGGTLIGVSTVSTGKPGHDTPTGSFEILQKRREHYSNLYDNAPMPFMQRLTWDGIALHAGEIPGRPASHGCVRLPLAFARHLYAATGLGARVHIVDAAPSAPREALTLASGEGGRATQLATAE
jgi:hypothetical protein